MHRYIDLTERQFGRWRVIACAGKGDRDGRARWACICDCGNKKVVSGWHLRSGDSQSCGCMSIELTKIRNSTHGESAHKGRKGTKEYRTWRSMIKRCEPEAVGKKYYFERGISVCRDWRNDFGAFLESVGRCPGPGFTLERIDNDKGYEPGNVCWANAHQQAINRRHWKGISGRGVIPNSASGLLGFGS